MLFDNDTIAAISTPLAPGGLGVIRLSGPKAIEIADAVFAPVSRKPLASHKGYTSAFGHIIDDGQRLDECVAAVFRAPRSYTGEDVVELSCHGGVFILQQVLRTVVKNGASLAGPGEFTKRAFLNGKLDLAQAEAVMDLISADSANAARAALAGHEGHLSREVDAASNRLVETAGHLAAWIDYPEEDLEELSTEQLEDSLRASQSDLCRLYDTYDSGRMIREGITAAIVGRPNVGKSTLMNLLARYERSIVTDIPGTTRDVVEESIRMGGYLLRIADTAGIRETADQVEAIGVALSKKRLESSDLVLAVFDISQPLSAEDTELLDGLSGRTAIAICNKSDLVSEEEMAQRMDEISGKVSEVIVMSAKNGAGLEVLEQRIPDILGLSGADASAAILMNERQKDCVRRALDALEEGIGALTMGFTFDAVSVCVDDAIAALMELSGKSVSEEVVANVFSKFCVGK